MKRVAAGPLSHPSRSSAVSLSFGRAAPKKTAGEIERLKRASQVSLDPALLKVGIEQITDSSQPSRPGWDQFRKEHLELGAGEEKKMREYRMQLDLEREEKLRGGSSSQKKRKRDKKDKKSKKKKKKKSKKKKRRREHASDGDASDDGPVRLSEFFGKQ